MPETRSTRIADTLKYFPTQIPFPKSTTEDFLRQSISDILAILNDPKPPIAPFLTFGDDTKNALRKIATLLNRAIPTPPRVLPLPVPAPVISPVKTRKQLPKVTPTVTPTIAPGIQLPRVASPPRPRAVSPERNYQDKNRQTMPTGTILIISVVMLDIP